MARDTVIRRLTLYLAMACLFSVACLPEASSLSTPPTVTSSSQDLHVEDQLPAATIRMVVDHFTLESHKALSEAFMSHFPQIEIVNGLAAFDETTGLVGRGTFDVAATSEFFGFADKREWPELTAIPYAAEGLAFVTTDRRVIDDLTWDDLLWAFWAGRASQLDWTPINTAPDTRTRWLFEKFVHTQPAKHSQVREVEDEDEVIIAVNRSADAIGYVRANYRPSPAITAVLHDWKWLKVNGSLPFPESQLQWFTPPTYPAMHRLFYVVNRDASPQIRSFLEFVLSDEGQAVVTAHGLTPILDIMQADSDLLVFQRAVLLLELDEV